MNGKELGKCIKQDLTENHRHERLGSVRVCGGNSGGEAKGSSDLIMKGSEGHNKKF